MSNKEIRLVEFKKSDVVPLTAIMKRAFDKDAQEFQGKEAGGPPGYDNGDFLRKYALHEKSSAFKIMVGNQAVGAVIVWIYENNENALGCLFVDSSSHDGGIGIRVWRMIEAMYPETRVWRTETPAFTRRNHHFYVNKCGFHIVAIENPKDPEQASYKMEKAMPVR